MPDWHPFPHAYAGWWGHALMRRVGTRLEVFTFALVDVGSAVERQHWQDAMRAACPDCGVVSRVLFDRRGAPLLGVVPTTGHESA